MKIKETSRWMMASILGTLAASVWAALPTEGIYAVLATKDFNADSLYANTLSGDAKTAVTSDPDYNKGFFGSSLTAASKVNRWTVYRNGVADPSATGAFPPNANYDYWLTSGNTLTTPNGGNVSGTYAFPGRSLTLSSGDIQHCSKGTTVVDLGTNVRIHGKGNSYGFPARSNADPQTRAQMTMAENADLLIKAGTSGDGTYGLDWTIVAPESAVIRLANSNESKGRWHWIGDCSGFRGTLSVGVNEMNDAAYGMTFVLDADFAGTISLDKWNRFTVGEKAGILGTLEVKDEGVLSLEAGKTVRVGSLDLKAGAVIEVKDLASGEVVAETALSVAGPVRVRLPAGGLNRGILTVPAACAISAADFVFVASADSTSLNLAVCDVRDNDNGTKTLWVTDVTPSRGLGTTLEVDRQVALDQADPLVQVRVKTGGTLAYGASSEAAARMPVYVESGAVVNLGAPFAAWSTIPLLWLDASAANTISNIVVTYDNSYVNYDSSRKLVVGQTICDTEGNPFVKGWFDCRNDAPAPVKMWNERYDALYNANHNVMSACHPRRIRGGLNGLDYLSFDRPNPSFVATFEGAGASETVAPIGSILPRVYFASIDSPVTAGADYAMRPRYAFLVYGSQQGGGGALLAGNANFLRAGTAGAHTKDDAIFASNATGAQVWVDGTEVDPTKTGLNGAWQVITVDFKSTGNAFTGLGYGVRNNEDNGGQAYAEVIFVTQELSERQRQSIEIYLAEKWGLAGQYAYPAWAATKAAVYGAGTLNVRSDATLSGGFAGTIDVQCKTLTIAGSALPPTDAVIDSTDMTGWFDPGWEGALAKSTSTAPNLKSPSERVMWLYDRRCGATVTDGFYALAATAVTRGPWVDASAHGLGPVRNWLDYSNVEYQPWPGTADSGIYNGDTLRFRIAQNNAWAGNVVSNAFQTLVMVQDSKYGGGQPFVDGNSVLPSAVTTLYKTRKLQSADSPIYPAGTSAILTDGTTRLDGEPVDGTKQGFHGRPEILSVQPVGDYAPVCFEYLSNNERLYGSDTRAAVQGEILMWNRKLAESELKTVEAYLSWKWLGVLPTGYVSLTNATLTGSGTIRVESVRLLPKFAPSAQFAVEVTAKDHLSFTMSAEGVADPLDLGASTLNLAASCAVELVLDGKPRAGDFALLTCGGGLEKTTFTLTPNVWQGRKLQLARTATSLTLHVPDSGCVLIFR